MKSEMLAYGMELLVLLDEIGKEISFLEFETKSSVKGEELKELLKYLHTKGYLKYKLGLFVDQTKIGDPTIKLLPKGMEVVLGKRDYFKDVGGISQTIHNRSIINGNQNQVAQISGDNSSIIQIQDNSKINVLKQIIQNDKELDETNKNKLFDILEKFNTVKDSGENAFDLIKKAGSVAIKYVPLFFGLLH